MSKWRIVAYDAPKSNEDGEIVKLSTLAWVRAGGRRAVPLTTDDVEELASQWVEQEHANLDYPEEVDVWVWEDGQLETARKVFVECRRTVTFYATLQEGGAK